MRKRNAAEHREWLGREELKRAARARPLPPPGEWEFEHRTGNFHSSIVGDSWLGMALLMGAMRRGRQMNRSASFWGLPKRKELP